MAENEQRDARRRAAWGGGDYVFPTLLSPSERARSKSTMGGPASSQNRVWPCEALPLPLLTAGKPVGGRDRLVGVATPCAGAGCEAGANLRASPHETVFANPRRPEPSAAVPLRHQPTNQHPKCGWAPAQLNLPELMSTPPEHKKDDPASWCSLVCPRRGAFVIVLLEFGGLLARA